jgi:Ser-tRNA(Ala) deacylase AlaX
MSENIEQAENVQPEQKVDEKPTDWQAKYEEMRQHSREWEQRAKANKAAADELEQIKAAQMTEQEKLTARAEAAEAKLAELEAQTAHDTAAKQVAEETGVPLDLLMFCSDEEAMTDFAAKYTADSRIPSAPSATGVSRIIKGDGEKPNTRDQFAKALEAAGF